MHDKHILYQIRDLQSYLEQIKLSLGLKGSTISW